MVSIAFLAWLYLFRNDYFYFVRNMFMVAMVLALVGYAAFPTAPPRMFPEHGFTDTVASFTGMEQDQNTKASFLVNAYAAVPSMHICFSLMIAVPAMALSSSALARALWSAYPLYVLFVIIVTANHFWFDAAAGAAVACLAAITAHQLARVRPVNGPGARRPAKSCERGEAEFPRLRARQFRLASRQHGRDDPRPLGGEERQELRASARDGLITSRLTPNAISITGFVLNVVAAVLVVDEAFVLAGVAFIVGSVMDTLDGRYSRMSGKGTLFGAFLDSTLDRVEEGIVLTAVAWYFAETGDEVAAAACVVGVLGSLMVSYTRARAEALGVECKVGLATRPVRVVILSIGLVFGAKEPARGRRPARALGLRDRRPHRVHRRSAGVARAWRAQGARRRARAETPAYTGRTL